MLRRHLPFFIFLIVFPLFANWHVFISTLSSLVKPKAGYSQLTNQALTDYITQKTSIEISRFYIVDSPAVFGGMTGIPTAPIMTFSKTMYETFSPGELSYVLLHETGHYALHHLEQEILTQGLCILGMYWLLRAMKYPLPVKLLVVGLAIVACGILTIQFMRHLEWQADTYALKHLDDPQAMIAATKKLEAAWKGPADNSLKRLLFYRGIPYSQRIQHAEGYSP